MQSLTNEQAADTLPDWRVGNIVPDGAAHTLLADGVPDPNTTRAMGLVPVNALKVTSVVGQGPDTDDEFVVTHLS